MWGKRRAASSYAVHVMYPNLAYPAFYFIHCVVSGNASLPVATRGSLLNSVSLKSTVP